jgi:hypothetical protein
MALCGYPTNIQFVHSDSQIDMVFDMGCRTLKIHDLRWLNMLRQNQERRIPQGAG